MLTSSRSSPPSAATAESTACLWAAFLGEVDRDCHARCLADCLVESLPGARRDGDACALLGQRASDGGAQSG